MEIYCFEEEVRLALGVCPDKSYGLKRSYFVPNKFLIELYEDDDNKIYLSTDGDYIDDFSSRHLRSTSQLDEALKNWEFCSLDVPLKRSPAARRFLGVVDWSFRHDNDLPDTQEANEAVVLFVRKLDRLVDRIKAEMG